MHRFALFLAACTATPSDTASADTDTADTASTPNDADGDGVPAADDCDDRDPSVGVGHVTFAAAPDTQMPLSDAEFFTLADLDGDGTKDLAVDDLSAGILQVYAGKGDGTYAETAREWSTPLEPARIEAADLDGDGATDLVLATYLGQKVVVYLQNGADLEATELDSDSVNDMDLGDLDGDGRLDIVVSTATDAEVFINAGDGSFGAAKAFEMPVGPYGVALGDLDGDGTLDIAVTSYNEGTVRVMHGDGDGDFAPLGDVPALFASDNGRLVDLAGDGALDLVVAGGEGSVVTLLGHGDGTFADTVVYATDTEAWLPLLVDVTADGQDDLLAITDGLIAFPGTGGGAFGAYTPWGSTTGVAWVEHQDVNGDALPDLVALNYGGRLQTWLGDRSCD